MEVLQGTKSMGVIIAITCLIVIGAMILDLISGLYKAKLRGEIRSSWGLKRSLSKFICYIGSLLIAAGVDVLMYFCKVSKVFHLDMLDGIPLITCVIGIFLLIVEFMSIREAADEKTRTEMSRVAELASKCIKKDDLVDALTKALINANAVKEDTHPKTQENEHSD